MAAFATFRTHYFASFAAVLDAAPGLCDFFKMGGVRESQITAKDGAISITITSVVTLQSINDGTVLTNNAARNVVALTAFDGAHCISLKDTQVGDFTENDMMLEFMAFVNASNLKAQLEVMTDLVGGTPGLSVNLPTGQIDFASDGSPEQNFLALNALDKAMAYVIGKTQGKAQLVDGRPPYAIITTYQGYGNLKTISNMGGIGVAGRLVMRGFQLYYDDVPIYLYDQSLSGWQGASDVAAFVCHMDCECLIFVDALTQEGFHKSDDGMNKNISSMYGWAGLTQATHYAEVVNPAS